MSYTSTRTQAFTITHARHLASKMAADMHICARYYGQPSDTRIDEYAEELAQRLRYGYVSGYEFGFKKDDKRVVTWAYRVDSSGAIQSDDRAGKVYSSADVSDAVFYNFMTYSQKWSDLPDEEKEEFEKGMPFQRGTGDLPSDGNGYWTSSDKSYSSGGVGLSRSSFRPFS